MGLVDLELATREEVKAEAIEILNAMTSRDMVCSVCSIMRAFYKRYDAFGYQLFLAEKNGEKNVSFDELFRRSREVKK